MRDVDLREKNKISEGDKLLQERWDTHDFSFGRLWKGEVATIKAAKEGN